jgi:aryl-alcohol dehydrogenase-like predicted oxidoreductase
MSLIPIRRFGADGPLTTAIGQGGAVISLGSYSDGVATIRAALDAGIRYFDTSPGYCNNESQTVFGEGLENASDEVMVATKVGYFENPKDFRNPIAIRKQIEDNLRRLRRDHVDLLQIHEANWSVWWRDNGQRESISRNEHYDFAAAPVFDVLQEAKAKGLCRFVGITGNITSEMTRVLRAVDVDALLIAFNYDLILRSAEVEALPLAAVKKAVGILGAIFRRRYVSLHPEWLERPPEWMNGELQKRFRSLYEIQRQCGLSLVELSVRFALSQPDTSIVLIGTKTPDETLQSVRAAEAGLLPEDLQRSIQALGIWKD